MMGSISHFMTKDHRECDEAFGRVEELVEKEDFSAAKEAFSLFFEDIDKHFRMEEEVIFKAFEECATDGCNPTQVMIMEHNQARALLEKLNEKLAAEDKKGFFAASDTLMILLQQHNMKEENIMYRLCDEALGDRALGVLDKAIHLK